MALIYTQDAQADIESIYEYIASEAGLATADRMIDAITGVCSDLESFPGMGRRRPELDGHGLEVRSIPERNWVLFYTQHQGDVYIVRVLHGARDIGPPMFETLNGI